MPNSRRPGRFPTLFPALVGIAAVALGAYVVVRTLVPPGGRNISDTMPGGLGVIVFGLTVLTGGVLTLRAIIRSR